MSFEITSWDWRVCLAWTSGLANARPAKHTRHNQTHPKTPNKINTRNPVFATIDNLKAQPRAARASKASSPRFCCCVLVALLHLRYHFSAYFAHIITVWRYKSDLNTALENKNIRQTEKFGNIVRSDNAEKAQYNQSHTYSEAYNKHPYSVSASRNLTLIKNDTNT